MADKNVDINFNTKANTKGVKEVKKSVDEIRKSFARQERAPLPTDDSSPSP